MKPLPLRVRIILALIAMALGTTAAAFLATRHFIDQSPRISVNPEMKQALDDALDLARDDYRRRKADLLDMGRHLAGSPGLLDAFRRRDTSSLQGVLELWDLAGAGITFLEPHEFPASLEKIVESAPAVVKDPDREDRLQLVVPVSADGQMVGAAVVTESLSKLLNVEAAVQTYLHLQDIEESLYEGFLLYFIVATLGFVVLASLIGVRMGLRITGPLYALLKGTRELARDNLDYRIPPGREDEIGLLVESFNRMAEDMKENNRRRMEAEKIAAWREIARRLAHEIKNPLTPIQLTVQQMSDKYDGDDPAYGKMVRDCAEIVTEEVESLRALVEEFANFARLPMLSPQRHNLNDIVLDAVRLYPDANIRLDLDPGLPELDVDGEQVRRALINLIENAIEAAGAGGVIRIATKIQGAMVGLSVSDSGPGLPPGKAEQVFQPYYSTKESGMGLGLAVVRGIMDDHGGNVCAGTAEEGGARFELSFPLPDDPPSPKTLEPPQALPRGDV